MESKKVKQPEKQEVKMKRPLQALLIAPEPEMRRAILNGTKKITIREGKRDYQPGFALLCCPTDPFCVGVDITDVRYCRLEEVTHDEYTADGFASERDMLDGMRKYYPNMGYQSQVTVIKWDRVRGKLVDLVKQDLQV